VVIANTAPEITDAVDLGAQTVRGNVKVGANVVYQMRLGDAVATQFWKVNGVDLCRPQIVAAVPVPLSQALPPAFGHNDSLQHDDRQVVAHGGVGQALPLAGASEGSAKRGGISRESRGWAAFEVVIRSRWKR